jgi:ABC-2 type transport system ATP-binding protein
MTLRQERYDVLTTRPAAESAGRGSNPPARDPYAPIHGSHTDQHETADAQEHDRQIPRISKEDSVIEAQHLTKRYSDNVAVDDLSFTVRPGIVTGFLGPNGSGKSTTMRMIMGLDHPTGGRVTVNGQHYHDLAWPLHEVGALLEAKAIHPGRSARAHLRMLAEANRIPLRRVEELLGLVGLASVAGQRAGKFSLGMGQRLGIAAALLGDPGVLIFDEPVNGLDPDGIRWVRKLLKGLAAEGRTVFVSSHLMSEMALTADEVIVIGRGRFLAQQPVAEMTARSAARFVRVRSPELLKLRAALDERGAQTVFEDGALTVRGMDEVAIGDLAAGLLVTLHELSPESASLEDAFMELTDESIEYHGALQVPARGGDR